MNGWLTAYIVCGGLFCLWNTTSQSFRLAYENLQQQGYGWAIFFVIAIGVILWPLGAIGYLVIWLLRFRRNSRS